MVNQPRMTLASIVLAVMVSTAVVVLAAEKPLTFTELLQFRQIGEAIVSADGLWVAYTLDPDRGDGEVVARSTAGDIEFRIERGETPVISSDGRWVAAGIIPTLEAREKADDDDKPKKGLSILDLSSGEELRIDEVEAFEFSNNGRWLAYQRYEGDDDDEGEEPAETSEPEEEKKREFGTELVLRKLADSSEITVEHVEAFVFAESAPLLAVTISAPEGEGNGVAVYDLRGEQPAERVLQSGAGEHTSHPTWAEEADHLAFVVAADDDGDPVRDAELWVWTGGDKARRMVSVEDAPEGFTVPSVNEIEWSRDGQRLFFGFKPVVASGSTTGSATATDTATETETENPFDPYDADSILKDRGVDVWHWNDPRIITNQKERWEEHEKDRVYRAVVHLSNDKVVPLADFDLPEVDSTDNPRFALGRSDVPYLREITWEGRFADLYAVNLETGDRAPMAERIAGGWRAPSASLSPDGTFALYYDDGDWHLFDTAEKTTRNLTADLLVSFADEDWDYPAEPPGYGSSEWLEDASAVLIYDKFDIWRAPADGGEVVCLTGGRGRDEQLAFRVVDLDPEAETIDAEQPFLVEGYHEHDKYDAFYRLNEGGGLQKLAGDGNHRLDLVAKAEEADRIVFTRERYDEFPDLRVTNSDFDEALRITDANPQIADYAWGTAELVEWTTDDGTPLQGVLIRPDNWEPGTRVPVMVYYYRFFSHRVHLFNEPVVNHRPSFPVYASHGYAVFLPDIKFQVGLPGPSAVECLTSGIDHLVEIGVADPEAVGLHGHSWSGYQTAYVVTQTDIFAAAVAGAPVSNMTSAYSGIRWGTGLARQFQYEKSQSRIGGSLWETPELYIENSPVFFADRIETPLLIQFGDEDEAVPWTQGIELYLACRRLDKDCIMLQYRGEPHHLKQDANKLDYSIKMKQFFDHHLKGEPAPAWMTDGVPYRGE